MRRAIRAHRDLASLLALALLVPGCNRSREQEAVGAAVAERGPEAAAPVGSPGPHRWVDVILTDSRIEMESTLAPGAVLFRVSNQGSERHSFALEGPGTVVELRRHLAPGEREDLAVLLAPGVYQLRCPLQNHPAGLPQQLAVTERAPR